jgi:hypothetical protein
LLICTWRAWNRFSSSSFFFCWGKEGKKNEWA